MMRKGDGRGGMRDLQGLPFIEYIMQNPGIACRRAKDSHGRQAPSDCRQGCGGRHGMNKMDPNYAPTPACPRVNLTFWLL